MKGSYLVITTACAKEEEAKAIIDALFREKLAACIQQQPVYSHYVWEGALCHEPEIKLSIKTAAALFPEVCRVIREQHPYAVPEILAFPVAAGDGAYLEWLAAACKGAPEKK